ncbi:Uncharacterized protein FKW44_011616 [Caligus rogercresseyi]|uniref:Dual specificity protein phosphatase n=1 Tax=Caligus rogercresseyi TaxID=217165 RepID=A0A7T8K895_CALRO|nr:Uncharacterized protein FKW44_011616 [Caligus rogercresseyi]
MPGYLDATDWEERRALNVDCDTVYPGIILANGDTLKNVEYIKKIGVTHVLNTAERHVVVNPNKYPLHGITYYGFHVDDHPSANISRHFSRTTEYMHEALSSGGTVLVNCVMGWSRSATIVVAYLMAKRDSPLQRHCKPSDSPGPFDPILASYSNSLIMKIS